MARKVQFKQPRETKNPRIPCAKCGQEFASYKGQKKCHHCRASVGLGGASINFGRAKKHRCRGCGYDIETRECVICKARKPKESPN